MFDKQDGGQVVYYGKDTEQHLNWKPLKKHTMDCGPNCFSLLRYANWDTSLEMAKRAPYGIYQDTIRRVLDEAYGHGHEWVDIYNYNQYHGNNETRNESPPFELNEYGEPIPDSAHLNHYLYKNEATLGFIGGEEKAHYFVVLREDGYQAIDAQNGTTNKLEDYIEYMELMGYQKNSFSILSSPEPTYQPNLVTIEMVKRYFPLPKKIRRGSVKSLRSKPERSAKSLKNVKSRKSHRSQKNKNKN
jgi:hypothetical protein